MSATSNAASQKQEIILKYPILAPDFDMTYSVLEVIRESQTTSHLVIEENEYLDVYYLKRLILPKDEKGAKVKKYYANLEDFGRSCLVPCEMVRVIKTETFDHPNETTEELLVFFEWGEPDCIDLSRLTSIQTLKYLKNILEMLKNVFATRGVTNNNICLHNVVLVGSQLKISGWKPIQNPDSDEKLNWREFIVGSYGKKRLDMCCLGLLWMELCEANVKDIIESPDMSFSDFFDRVVDRASDSGKFGVDHVIFTKM